LNFPRQIFEKYSNIKFHEDPSSGSRIVPMLTSGRKEGRTDMTKTIVAFRKSANAPKNWFRNSYRKRHIRFIMSTG